MKFCSPIEHDYNDSTSTIVSWAVPGYIGFNMQCITAHWFGDGVLALVCLCMSCRRLEQSAVQLKELSFLFPSLCAVLCMKCVGVFWMYMLFYIIYINYVCIFLYLCVCFVCWLVQTLTIIHWNQQVSYFYIIVVLWCPLTWCTTVLACCIVLYCIVVFCIMLWCIVLHFVVVYCIVVHCVVVYCIVLCLIVFRFLLRGVSPCAEPGCAVCCRQRVPTAGSPPLTSGCPTRLWLRAPLWRSEVDGEYSISAAL